MNRLDEACYTFPVRSSGRGLGGPTLRRVAAGRSIERRFCWLHRCPPVLGGHRSLSLRVRLVGHRKVRSSVRLSANPQDLAHHLGGWGEGSKTLTETQMSNLAVFSFENAQVRVLGTPEAPLFVAVDIAAALGFQKPSNAVAQHVDSDDLVKSEITDSLGRMQTVNCITESGMYALIFGSKLESAKRFKRWVTSEVLPAIRKTGSYSAATLTPSEQLQIRTAVAKRAKSCAIAYQTIYHALYARFQVAKYDQIKPADLQDALDFIATCEVKLPVLEEKKPADGAWLSREDLEHLRTYVYYERYLFRGSLRLFYDLLHSVASPKAAHFYSAITEPNWTRIEEVLDRAGVPVSGLPCYQHWIAAK